MTGAITISELRFSSLEQYSEVEAWCEKVQQRYENWAPSPDFRLLFAETEA